MDLGKRHRLLALDAEPQGRRGYYLEWTARCGAMPNVGVAQGTAEIQDPKKVCHCKELHQRAELGSQIRSKTWSQGRETQHSRAGKALVAQEKSLYSQRNTVVAFRHYTSNITLLSLFCESP